MRGAPRRGGRIISSRKTLIILAVVAGAVASALILEQLTSKHFADWLYIIAAGGAAIAVAFFTFELWQSTEKLWTASTQQARILERTAEVAMRTETAVLVAEMTAYNRAEQDQSVRPVIQYRISNYGRTPATVRRFQDRHRWVASLPESPDFDREPLEARPERNIVLVPNLQTNIFVCRLDPVSSAEWNAQPERRSHVIIRIEYEDIFGRIFRQGFALAVVNDAPLVFDVVGGRVYNYREELPEGGAAATSATTR